MCLIIYKPQTVEVPDSYFINGFKNNSDGWGIMYAENNEVVVHKGMDLPGFLLMSESIRDKTAMVHFRFATHGVKNTENCHPFKVTDDIWLMHNGIMTHIPEIDKSKSDTWHFCEYILGPILTSKPELFCTDELEEIIMGMAGIGNKFTLMHKDGRVQIINEKAGSIKEGLWLSNSGSVEGTGRWFGSKSYIYNDDDKYYKGMAYSSKPVGQPYGLTKATKSVTIPIDPDTSGEMNDEDELEYVEYWEEQQKKYEMCRAGVGTLDDLFTMDHMELEEFVKQYPDEVVELLYYGSIDKSDVDDRCELPIRRR